MRTEACELARVQRAVCELALLGPALKLSSSLSRTNILGSDGALAFDAWSDGIRLTCTSASLSPRVELQVISVTATRDIAYVARGFFVRLRVVWRTRVKAIKSADLPMWQYRRGSSTISSQTMNCARLLAVPLRLLSG